MKGIRVRIGIYLLITLSFVGCARYSDESRVSFTKQGVTGRIWFKPAWDVSLLPWPDSSYFEPRLLGGIRISLMEFYGDNKEVGKVVATTESDSLGYYELFSKPGTYYLVVHGAKVAGITHLRDGLKRSDEISNLEVVDIKKNQIIELDFEIIPLIAQ